MHQIWAQLEQELKRTGKNNMYHAFMNAYFNDDSVMCMEKNERPNFVPGKECDYKERVECKSFVPSNANKCTFAKMVNGAEKTLAELKQEEIRSNKGKSKKVPS